MAKVTVAVQSGLGEIAEALKVEGFNVVTLEKNNGYTNAIVYTGVNSDWLSLSHSHVGDFKGRTFDSSDDVISIDATNKTSREVVDHLREIFGQDR